MKKPLELAYRGLEKQRQVETSPHGTRKLKRVTNTKCNVGLADAWSCCYATQKAVAARSRLTLALVVETGQYGVQVGSF